MEQKKFILTLLLLSFLIGPHACQVQPIDLPYHYDQERNACWMFSVLQCLYRLHQFREGLEKIQQSTHINSENKNFYNFLSNLKSALDSRALPNQPFPEALYNNIFNSVIKE